MTEHTPALDADRATEIALDLVTALAPEVPGGSLRHAHRLVDDLGFDSLRLVELTMALEDALGTGPLPQSRLASVTTVGRVVDLARENAGTHGKEAS